MAVARGRELHNKLSSMNTIYIPCDGNLLLKAVGRLKVLTPPALLQSFSLMWVRLIIFHCISLPLRNLYLNFDLSQTDAHSGHEALHSATDPRVPDPHRDAPRPRLFKRCPGGVLWLPHSQPYARWATSSRSWVRPALSYYCHVRRDLSAISPTSFNW